MTRGRGPLGCRARRGAFLPLLVALALPGSVTAQDVCSSRAAASPGEWNGPLARRVRVDIGEMPLRDALARVAAAGGIRISHALGADPLDRPVCVALDDVAIGDALVVLLREVPVRIIAAGADHVVLAPERTAASASAGDPSPEPVVPLQPIVVHADPGQRAAERQHVVVDVLDGDRLADTPHGQLWPALNAVAPGMYLWGGSGGGGSYASIRGASSFESTAPKVYIDGVQVADPLLLTRLSPESIERIEVIRGPQGAALYGADAISGVLDITTRAATPRTGPQFGVRSSFGLSATAFSPGTALAHDHAVNVSVGSTTRSATLDAAMGTSGEPLAGSWSRHFDAGAALRLVGEQSLFTGTFRFQSQHAATALRPLVAMESGDADDRASARSFLPVASADAVSVRHFTAALRALLMPEGAWTHTFVVGFDGYALDGGEGAARDAFEASFGGRAPGSRALRGTLRASSRAAFEPTDRVRAAFTASLEQTILRRSATRGGGFSLLPDSLEPVTEQVRAVDASRNDTGLGAQVEVALDGRWFLTGGMRFEYTDALAGLGGLASLPSIGAAWTAFDGPVDLKLRTAWGKGIRWPELTTGGGGWQTAPIVYVPVDLGPEQQTGVEAGADVDVGDVLSLRLTRFDQVASGLIQRVVLPPETGTPAGITIGARPTWAYQNVGEITNRGWEVEGTVAHGPFSLLATFAAVDSRVRQLAVGYAGDLLSGDRMLGVPARTYGASVNWAGRGWSANLGVTRATDWINYDRIALASALLDGSTVIGREDLRAYWRRYEGVTHLGAGLSRDLDAGVTLLLSAENLLNRQTGEPDNAAIMRGRTISLGVRATF